MTFNEFFVEKLLLLHSIERAEELQLKDFLAIQNDSNTEEAVCICNLLVERRASALNLSIIIHVIFGEVKIWIYLASGSQKIMVE